MPSTSPDPAKTRRNNSFCRSIPEKKATFNTTPRESRKSPGKPVTFTPSTFKHPTTITFHTQPTHSLLTVNAKDRPVLLSLDGRGFYVLHYSAIPEENLARVSFDLVDPNTGEGATADALVDPKLIQDLNSYNRQPPNGKAFLIWINTSTLEVSWQQRKTGNTFP